MTIKCTCMCRLGRFRWVPDSKPRFHSLGTRKHHFLSRELQIPDSQSSGSSEIPNSQSQGSSKIPDSEDQLPALVKISDCTCNSRLQRTCGMHVDVENKTTMDVHLYALCVTELFINLPHNMDTLVMEMEWSRWPCNMNKLVTKLVVLLVFIMYFQYGMDSSMVLVDRGWHNCLIAPTPEACAKLLDFHRHCGESEFLRAVGKQRCMQSVYYFVQHCLSYMYIHVHVHVHVYVYGCFRKYGTQSVTSV